MIDLHTHTNESDGTLSPHELVRAAVNAGLEALAITDHDTFAGYDQAAPGAQSCGLNLVCGVELSTRYRDRPVHLLGYFLKGGPPDEFRDWMSSLQSTRHKRNVELVRKLQSCGVAIGIEEVYEPGRKLPGRPHFAALLLSKGYVSSRQQAFDEYLSESGKCYVARDEPDLEESIARIEECGGIASLAHPTRFSRDRTVAEAAIRAMMKAGLRAVEVHHSDFASGDMEFYRGLADRLRLLVTGGSDFHGENKPAVQLGTGVNGNVRVPKAVLEDLLNASG